MSHVVLYDGVCALCNRWVRVVLLRDTEGAFRLAPLQGDYARAALQRHGRDPEALDTVVVLADAGSPDERVLVRSRAVLFVARYLGGPWRVLGVFGILPTFLLDLAYRLVARIRYPVFGRYESCPLPDAEQRERFVEGAFGGAPTNGDRGVRGG